MSFNIKFKYPTVSTLGLLYIISTTIAMLNQSGIFNWYYLTAIFISFMWGVIGCIGFLSNHSMQNSQFILKVCYYMIFPWIIFILYNLLLFYSGVAYAPFMKSSFVQILFLPSIILGAIGSYYIFGKDTLRYFLYSIFLEYIILLTILLFKMGPIVFFDSILGSFFNNSVGNPFEQNSDLIFALGLLIIYYSNLFIKNKSREITHSVLVIILVILGGKRIEVSALLILCAINILLHKMQEKNKSITQHIISLGMIIAMFSFVFEVISGNLSQFVYSHNINSMGRMQMWDYVAQYVNFDFHYLGKGYSFSNLLLETNRVLTYQDRVYVLHSDILKIYFDLGFPMFTFWGLYFLHILPFKMKCTFGYEISNLFWTFIIYLFMLYFTDNAINYVITQTLLIILMLEAIDRRNQYYGVNEI